MKAEQKAVTGEGNAPRGNWLRNLGEAKIEEEILSDGSKVYNVHVPAQTIYCKSDLDAINFVTDLSEAIARAQ